jgi:DNA-directed RNA polymerase specialized sigma24 family protein
VENGLLHTETELVTRLKNYDRKAYEHFYDKYGPAMYGLIYRIVLKEDIANTVMIETFLQLKGKMKDYEASNRSVFSFALNISRDTAYQYIETYRVSYQNTL